MNNKILYIVVLYRMTLAESLSYKGLCDSLSEEELKHDVYIHDNSKHNIYLAGAYNMGLTYAISHGYEWIVLLDEDTTITAAYITALKAAVIQKNFDVCVPTLVDNSGKVLSPSTLYGIPVAMNSCLAIRCRTVQEMGGFNTNYPLDFLDNWLCHKLYQANISLQKLPVEIVHNLSVNNPKHYISRSRYLSLLEGERNYAREFGYVWRYKLHLVGRLVKWLLTRHVFVKETFEALIRI